MSASAPIVSVNYDIQVAEAIAELSAATFPGDLRAVLLTGSLARGEGTWLHDGSRVRLAGDADVFVIFDDRAALPPPNRVAWLKRAVEDRLATAGIEAHLQLGAAPVGYIRGLQPNIFSYELITQGKVLWGDAHILQLAPAFTVSDIPLDDGFRLLMNRMIELLDAVCEVDAIAMDAPAVCYRAMKLWLDMATSYLLFERHYVPTYRGRASRLSELAADPSVLAPVSLARFASTIALATRCKLGKSSELREFADLDRLLGDAQSIWRWELERLTGSSANDTELLRRWIAAEPLFARLRAWAGVGKGSGATRAIASMPNWIDLARTGSPRRLIYAAASELLFALPSLLKEGATHSSDSRWNQLRRGLPVTDSPENRSSLTWRRLGRSIAFNYNFFLVTTRS